MTRATRPLLALCLTLALPISSGLAAGSDLETSFLKPPQDAKPGVWWHWMGSKVSREGITRDLEVFKLHFDIRAFLEIPLGASK